MVYIKTVLVLDAVGSKCVDILKKHGFEVTVKEKLSKEALIAEIPAYDALIIRTTTKVTFEVLNAGTNLKVVASASAYFRNIDLFAAVHCKIGVLHAPKSGVQSVYEFTCGLVLAMSRRLLNISSHHLRGMADQRIYSSSLVSGKTLALFGIGDISMEVAKRMNIFGMTVIGYDPLMTTEECARIGIKKVNQKELWAFADYIVIYTSPFKSTRTFITAEVLRKCKKGITVITIGYIDIIQARDWLRALHDGILSGHVAGAAFDVYNENTETLFKNYPVFKHPNVMTTVQLSMETEEAKERGGQEAAEQIVNLVRPGAYRTMISTVVQMHGM